MPLQILSLQTCKGIRTDGQLISPCSVFGTGDSHVWAVGTVEASTNETVTVVWSSPQGAVRGVELTVGGGVSGVQSVAAFLRLADFGSPDDVCGAWTVHFLPEDPAMAAVVQFLVRGKASYTPHGSLIKESHSPQPGLLVNWVL